MVIDPKIAVEEKWITASEGIEAKQLQPNGIDLRLDRLALVAGRFQLFIAGSSNTEHIELKVDDEGLYHLLADRCYEGTALEYVEVPQGVLALIIHRSTLNRNGTIVLGSVYDAGFKGPCGFSVRPCVRTSIQRYARVAQIIFLEAQGARTYSGQYQGKATSEVLKSC